MEAKDQNPEADFSDNPQYDINTENELIKLKLQAERGGMFYSVSDDLPPEVEAQFLKNIQLFEESFEKAAEVTIYERIGSPEFIKADELNPDETEKELQVLMDLLRSKNIVLDVLGQYESSVIYKFV